MKKSYLTPEFEVVSFSVEDVLYISGPDGTIVDGSTDLGGWGSTNFN